MTIREVLSDGPVYRLRALRSILSHRTLDDKRAGYCTANIDGRMNVRRGSVRKKAEVDLALWGFSERFHLIESEVIGLKGIGVSDPGCLISVSVSLPAV